MTDVTDQPKPAAPAPKPVTSGLPKLLKPYLYITAYYLTVTAAVIGMLALQPQLLELLPVGGAANFGAVGQSTFEQVDPAQIIQPAASTLADGIKLALAIVSSFILMLPVTWICMGARKRKDVSQSFIQTILVLPLLVTGIVHVVHNSLALAFAVGVSCGIHAVEVAAIISIFFNYTVLGLWATEFGSETTGKQMFSREWMAGEQESKKRDDRKKHRDDDEDDD
jgi:hypothetical protein